MSTQPWQPLKWCLLCTERRTEDVLCPSCMAELDMRVAAIVGEEPARFDDMLALVTDHQLGRCVCGARIVNDGDVACTQCSMLDNENTRDC